MICVNCGSETSNPKFCNNSCQSQAGAKRKIADWKTGLISGTESDGTVIEAIKNYLRAKHYNRCSLCGWCKVNPYLDVVPLVVDHIDGDCTNNKEENLQLICWNCDAIGPTFGGLNRGNGRTTRRK